MSEGVDSIIGAHCEHTEEVLKYRKLTNKYSLLCLFPAYSLLRLFIFNEQVKTLKEISKTAEKVIMLTDREIDRNSRYRHLTPTEIENLQILRQDAKFHLIQSNESLKDALFIKKSTTYLIN